MWDIERTVSKGDYTYAVVPSHPKATAKGYVLLHRIVMENHLDRLLDDDELVHHRNENKKDNGIENLEVMSVAEHNRHHAQEIAYISLVCANCGIEFSRRANQRSSMKGYTDAFCSRSCNGKYQRRKQLSAPVS